MRFDFPEGMRPATVEEREEFYRTEFPREEVERYMARFDRFVPVVDVGSESTRYRPRFREAKGKLVRIEEFDGVDDLKDRIVEYAPEDLYYVTLIEREDRIETNPEQELVIDLDPEHLECRRCDRARQRLDKPASDYVFCRDCFRDLARETRQLHAVLDRNFDDLRLVFSGRGFHVHVGDDAAYKLDREDRRQLSNKLTGQFPVDRITTADQQLMRLPGSLHGLVSRVVTEVEPADLSRPDRILESTGLPGFLRGSP